MAKAIRAIASVVAVVAQVVGYVALATGNPAIAAVAFKVSKIATVVAAVAAGVVALTARKPDPPGTSNQFRIDPQAGVPYMLGRTFFGGNVVHVDAYGDMNKYQSFVMVWSGGGPIDSIESVLLDREVATFSGGAATGYYAGFMNLATQLGASPEAAALVAPFAGFPQWDAASKLSGFAAGLWTLKFDKDGKKYSSGIPEFGIIGKGVKVYDPRLDSTFPGGSGSCRPYIESTYVWSENPWLHAITWAIGRVQNGKRVLGCSVPVANIVLSSYVEAANVADANGFKAGGILDGSGNKWNNLKLICEAGSGEPMQLGAKLSCLYDAPRVSLRTITADDMADGPIVVPATQSRRSRINGIIPRFRSEAHNWEIIPADTVRATAYVTEDGGERTREQEFALCQDKDHAAKLAGYKIVNAREFGPIEITLKPEFINYKPGDCVTLDISESGLVMQKCIILTRIIDPTTVSVAFTLRSETSAKHAFALGQTGTVPPTPSIMSSEDLDAAAFAAKNTQIDIEIVPVRSYSADFAGAVDAGQLPDTISPKATSGGVSIKTSDAVSYALTAIGATATVNNTNGSPTKGDITVTALTLNSGYLDLAVTVSGVAYPAKRVVIGKNIAAPPSSGGPTSKTASDSSFATINTTSYTVISDTMTVNLVTGESLYGTAPLGYNVAGTGGAARTATIKWQYSPTAAATWTDFTGSAITGSTAFSENSTGGVEPEYIPPVAGYGDFNQTQSLSAAVYDVRLVALLNTNGRDVSFVGTATIEAKV